jgi:hypothetical protein
MWAFSGEGFLNRARARPLFLRQIVVSLEGVVLVELVLSTLRVVPRLFILWSGPCFGLR